MLVEGPELGQGWGGTWKAETEKRPMGTSVGCTGLASREQTEDEKLGV